MIVMYLIRIITQCFFIYLLFIIERSCHRNALSKTNCLEHQQSCQEKNVRTNTTRYVKLCEENNSKIVTTSSWDYSYFLCSASNSRIISSSTENIGRHIVSESQNRSK